MAPTAVPSGRRTRRARRSGVAWIERVAALQPTSPPAKARTTLLFERRHAFRQVFQVVRLRRGGALVPVRPLGVLVPALIDRMLGQTQCRRRTTGQTLSQAFNGGIKQPWFDDLVHQAEAQR